MLLKPSIDTLGLPVLSKPSQGLRIGSQLHRRYASSQQLTRTRQTQAACSQSFTWTTSNTKQSCHRSRAINITPCRSFSLSQAFHKGQKNRNRGGDEAQEQEHHGAQKGSQNADLAPLSDAVELTALKSEVRRIQDKLKKSVGVLKPGGQFSPIFLESLRVDMSKLMPAEPTEPVYQKSHEKETKTRWVKNDPSTHDQQPDKTKSSKKKGHNKNYVPRSATTVTQPLKEVAQVIPRGGKQAIIMLNEEDFVKPVTSALLNSPYSLNPQPSASNPLELIVPIPPPSAETRRWNVTQVDKYLERAENDLREGRAEMQKTLRALSGTGQLGPDALRKAQKDMEKVVNDAKSELKKMCDASKKALQ